MVDEMIKLRKYLDEMSIEWWDSSDSDYIRKYQRKFYSSVFEDAFNVPINSFGIDRTHFNYKNHEFSAINGFGTYGGIQPFLSSDFTNPGLIEFVIDNHSPLSCLTADQVIEKVKEFDE